MTDLPVELIIGFSGNTINVNSVGLLYDASIYQGLSGASGDSGPSGAHGWTGVSGASGESGFVGATGSLGQSGGSGWSGWSGWSGQPQWCTIRTGYLYSRNDAQPYEWKDWCETPGLWLTWQNAFVISWDTTILGLPKRLVTVGWQNLAPSAPAGWGQPTEAYIEYLTKGRRYATQDDKFILCTQASTAAWSFSGNMGVMVYHKGQKFWSAVVGNPFGTVAASIAACLISQRGRMLRFYIQPPPDDIIHTDRDTLYKGVP